MQHYTGHSPYTEEALTKWNSRNPACDCHQYLKYSAREVLLSTLKLSSTTLSRKAALQQPAQQVNSAYIGINAFPQEYNQRQWPWASWNKKKQSILLQTGPCADVVRQQSVFTAHSRTAELLPMNQVPALKTRFNAELLSASFVGELVAWICCQSFQSLTVTVASVSPDVSREPGYKYLSLQLHCYLKHYLS